MRLFEAQLLAITNIPEGKGPFGRGLSNLGTTLASGEACKTYHSQEDAILLHDSEYSLREDSLTMIVKSTGSVEGWRTRSSGPRRGAVRSPTSLLMINLTVIDVSDYVDLLVLGLMSMLPLFHGVRSVMYRVWCLLLQKISGRHVFLLLLIVHAIRPGVGLPFLRHETTRHSEDAFSSSFHNRHREMIAMMIVVRSARMTT